MTHQCARLRPQRGITYIDVCVTTIVLTLIALAVMASLNALFRTARYSEPTAIGRTSVANVQTDLNAMTMYDATPIQKLTNGQTLTMPAPATIVGTTYPPADTLPSTVTIQSVTPDATDTHAQVQINYNVAAANGATALSGNEAVTIFQRAPTGCSPVLVGVPGTGC
jgi:Tfp pilus assembly protein PilV